MQSGRVMVSVPGSGSHLLGRVNHDCAEHLAVSRTEGCISRKIRAETNRAAASTRGISTASARAGCVPRNSRDAPFQNHIPKAASKIGSTAAVGAGSPAQWETRKVVRGAVGNNGAID